jgi:hypothetical protein
MIPVINSQCQDEQSIHNATVKIFLRPIVL